MTAVRFDRRGDLYAVTFPYSPTIVELLKTEVPHWARTWVPGAKTWLVEDVYATHLAGVLRRMGHVTIGLEPPKRQRHDADDPTAWARQLFKRVGPARTPAVYRALSKCLHPDVGGSTELQRELNTAHHEISTNRRESKST